MTETKKEKAPEYRTPRGTLKWPKLAEADYGTKDYPKPDGEFSTKFLLPKDAPETKAFLKLLDPLHKAAITAAEEEFKTLKPETRKKLKKVSVNGLYTELLDPETEEPTGEIEFKFAMAASGERKKGPKAGTRWNRKCVMFDAKGKPIVKIKSVYGGTEAKVSFEARPYFIKGTGAAGLKLALNAVQILKLVAGGSKSAKEYGFEEEEGFDASDLPPDDDVDTKAQGDTGAEGSDGDAKGADGEGDF